MDTMDVDATRRAAARDARRLPIADVLRQRLCDQLITRCVRRGRELADEELRRRTLVFAPHPDDEVLGCGGTIARMRQLGAEVEVVFVTDGERSHEGRVAAPELAVRRRAEARVAAGLLGLDAGRLTFLGFGDGRLADHAGEARTRVAELLATHRPAQILLPDADDPHPDHRITNAIVRAAAGDGVGGPLLFEYVVHLWRYWPWCGCAPSGAAYMGLRSRLDGAWTSGRMLARLRRFVRVDGVIADKRRALAAHASQVSALLPGGPNVQDWSGGEFLAWIFSGYEFLTTPQRR